LTEQISSRRIKAIVGGAIGNLVEWYDWYAYSAFSLYFSAVFFPKGNQTAQLLQTAGIFALGFVMRPVGGWMFGVIGDRLGRKQAMTISVLLMSAGSLVIAGSPGYASIGIAAPILLLVARLVQGLSVGGEYGVSATYLSEMATRSRRGFYSSFQYVTLVGGQIVALAIQLALQALLSDEQLHAWGWRVPFFIGSVLSVVAFYIRSSMDETKAFEEIKPQKGQGQSSLRKLLEHPKAVLTVVGLTVGGTLAFYTYTTYMQKFLVNTAGLTKERATLLSLLSLLIFAALQPLFGSLSDRLGRKPMLLAFGICGTLFTVPLFYAMLATNQEWVLFIWMIVALIIVSGYTSINAVVKAELFPAQIRALGVGFPYAITVALFGGSAEYIALWLKDIGHESWFYFYVSGVISISLLVYILMADTRNVNKMTERDG
jgi:MHS family alpha-ketoglutarate permease-like MFS transporter